MRFYREPEPVADFVFEFFNFLAFEFHDLFTILADDVVVMRMFRVVGIVKICNPCQNPFLGPIQLSVSNGSVR